jgi:glutathione S-transferase
MDVSQDLKGESRAHHVAGDIARVQQIWTDCRKRFGAEGPFLFGRFSVADGMFAPVVTRFATYGVKLEPVAAAYVAMMMKLPAMVEWVEAARREPWIIVYPDPTKP